jgi:hypothetical protein
MGLIKHDHLVLKEKMVLLLQFFFGNSRHSQLNELLAICMVALLLQLVMKVMAKHFVIWCKHDYRSHSHHLCDCLFLKYFLKYFKFF